MTDDTNADDDRTFATQPARCPECDRLLDADGECPADPEHTA